jgi:hypothetical protein
MSCKPLTKKEWESSVADAFSLAVKSAYQDLIDEAIKDERQQLLAELLKLKKGVASVSQYVQGRWDLIGEFEDIILARGKK